MQLQDGVHNQALESVTTMHKHVYAPSLAHPLMMFIDVCSAVLCGHPGSTHIVCVRECAYYGNRNAEIIASSELVQTCDTAE